MASFLSLCRYFYPRSPCGERRLRAYQRYFAANISIHALLAESDPITCCLHMQHAVFLSTLSLRRATLGTRDYLHYIRLFLSTLSLRRATMQNVGDACVIQFLSTLSLRRATRYHAVGVLNSRISIHALLAESDRISKAHGRTPAISIHALLAESDAYRSQLGNMVSEFLSTLSLRRATAKMQRWEIPH